MHFKLAQDRLCCNCKALKGAVEGECGDDLRAVMSPAVKTEERDRAHVVRVGDRCLGREVVAVQIEQNAHGTIVLRRAEMDLRYKIWALQFAR